MGKEIGVALLAQRHGLLMMNKLHYVSIFVFLLK